MVISKKKAFTRIDLVRPTFRPEFIRISKKHLQQNETTCAIFEGGKKRGARGKCLICLTQFPLLVSTAACEYGANDQTAGNVITSCLVLYQPNGPRALSDVGKSLAICLMEIVWPFSGPSGSRPSFQRKRKKILISLQRMNKKLNCS